MVREGFVKDRSATVNRIHGLLLEMGIALTPGFKSIRTLPVLLDDCTFSPLVKAVLRELHGHFNYLISKLDQLNKELEGQVAGDDLTTRLMTIPCIGPITSGALAAELGDGKHFDSSGPAERCAHWRISLAVSPGRSRPTTQNSMHS